MAHPVPQAVAHRLGGVSWRAVVVGLLMSLLISLGSYASLFVFRSTEPTRSFLPAAVGTPLLVVILFNVLVGAWRRRAALTPAELAVIFTMGLCVTGLPVFMFGFQMTLWPAAPYFATPENRWAEVLLPHLKDQAWMMPAQGGDVIRWFCEGLPAGQSIPWWAWVLPLMWWQALVWAFYLVCFCLVVLFRRHWVVYERLTFPIMQVAVELIRPGPAGRLPPPIFHSRVFWLGVALSLGAMVLSIATFWSDAPFLSPWNLAMVSFGKTFQTIQLNLSFLVIGLVYFAHRQVSFSVWFFCLFYIIEDGLARQVGLEVRDNEWMLWFSSMLPLWQGMGAFTVMVLWSVWMARRHLAAVMRHVFGRPSGLDDAEEMVSYRTALGGLAWGLAFMAAWLAASGMEWKAIAVFLPAVLLIYIGITLAVIQTGVPYFVPPLIAQPLVYQTFGIANLAPSTLTALGYSYGWHGDVQSVFMVAAAHGAKLQGDLRLHGRGLAVGIALAVLLASLVVTTFFVWLGYTQGGYNIREGWLDIGRQILEQGPVPKLLAQQQGTARPVDWTCWYLFGSGALGMIVLTFLTYRFPWWPLHPVGLAIGCAWPIRYQVFSLFLGWLAKAVILWLGDARLYRRLAPFFVGLVVGYFLGVGLGLAVDIIWFPGEGHGL